MGCLGCALLQTLWLLGLIVSCYFIKYLTSLMAARAIEIAIPHKVGSITVPVDTYVQAAQVIAILMSIHLLP